MAKIVTEAATAEAKSKSEIIMAEVIPMAAEIRCPPTSGQGWENGPPGALRR